ncbi:MAG: DNA polymerase III subunit delta [Patescibacteria group bacterium]
MKGKNTYLIYGEDTFRSRQKIEAIRGRYREKFADLEIINLAGGSVSFEELESKLFAQAMFANRKLVVISGFLSQAPRKIQEQLTARLDDIPDSTVTVFYEQGQPDRRLVVFKKLNRPGFSEQYKLLTQIELVPWIEAHVKQYQGTITRQAAEQLALWFGSDTWRIHQEIAKLLTFDSTITVELVGKLTPPEAQGNIFELLDTLWSGNEQDAARKLTELVTSGQPLLQILSTIATAIRNLLLVKESIESSPSITSFQVARTLALHPYVVTKAFRSVRSIDKSELVRKLELVGYIDQRIKTGRLEPGVALEILVARLVG